MITNTYKVTGKIENGKIEPCQNKLIWHNIVFPTEDENHEEPEKAAFMFELIRKFLKTIGDKYSICSVYRSQNPEFSRES